MKFTLCSCKIFSESFQKNKSKEKAFFYLKSGVVRVDFEKSGFELKSGQGVMVGGGFNLTSLDENVLGLYVVFLADDDFKHGISIKTGPKSEIRNAAAKLFDNVENSEAREELLCLLSVEAERFLKAANKIISFRCANFAEMSMEYIDKNFNGGITLSDVAGFCGISKSLLEKEFAEKYGISPWKYITQKRIEAAKKLLRTTNEKSGKIAESVGFASPQRFNDMFVKSTGQTPGKYRESLR